LERGQLLDHGPSGVKTVKSVMEAEAVRGRSGILFGLIFDADEISRFKSLTQSLEIHSVTTYLDSV
jgi:hypothetical protein